MAILEDPIREPDPAWEHPSTGQGWYPDPAQRHKLRYFDGADWTPHLTHYGPTPCIRCTATA